MCSAAHPSAHSPLSEEGSGPQEWSLSAAAFPMRYCGAYPFLRMLQCTSTDIYWGLFSLAVVQVERQPYRVFFNVLQYSQCA